MAAQSIDQNIAYEEFEPFCKWQRKEDRDVLEIHLPDFKKEQLIVLISKHGVLKILGERPTDASKSKGIRFDKEVAAPNTKYDTHSIHAKFVDNNLIITLPKAKPEPTLKPAAAGAQEKAKAATPSIGGNAAASLAVTVVVATVLAAYVHFMYKSTVERI